MDAEEALLAALSADPADEVAWLALADRLEEGGRPEEAHWHRLMRGLRGMPEGAAKVARSLEVQGALVAGLRPAWPAVVNSVGMRLTLVPAGVFLMGSDADADGHCNDEQLHEVELTRPCYVSAHLVTQGQFAKVTRKNPSAYRPGGRGGDYVRGIDHRTLPVEMVSWHEAVDFCERLSRRKAEKAAGRKYRLPTEAEWEYACRAWGASSLAFHFGARLSMGLACYDWTMDDDAPEGVPAEGEPEDLSAEAEPGDRTVPVGSFPPNAFGLYDMHGNLDEWCHDLYDKDYYIAGPRQDPKGPKGDSGQRVLRGGGYVDDWEMCRAAWRFMGEPDDSRETRGFRVVCEWR